MPDEASRPDFRGFGENLPPWPLTVRGVAQATAHQRALELGPAPGLRDVKYLVPFFDRVDLVDTEPTVADAIAKLPTAFRQKIQFFGMPFETFGFEREVYDFVNAVNALPFAGENFNPVFQRLVASLRPSGVFSGTLWTPAHAWNTTRPQLAFQTEAEMLRLLQGLTIKEFEPDVGLRETRMGEVHWSAYNIIAVKPETNESQSIRT